MIVKQNIEKDRRLIRLCKYAVYIIATAFALVGHFELLLAVVITHILSICLLYIATKDGGTLEAFKNKNEKIIERMLFSIFVFLLLSILYLKFLN